MSVRTAIHGGVLAASLGFVATAMAQPADCSVGAIPDQPLVMRMQGAPDRPLPGVKLITIGTITTSDGGKHVYNQRSLEMKDRAEAGVFDPVVEIEVSFLVAEGQPLGGRVFRRPAAKQGTPQYDAQDKVDGQVVFQSWSVKVPAAPGSATRYAIDVSHVGFIASARVEFAKQAGNTVPGKIHLCVPGGQSSFFGSLKSPTEIVGRFTATVQ